MFEEKWKAIVIETPLYLGMAWILALIGAVLVGSGQVEGKVSVAVWQQIIGNTDV